MAKGIDFVASNIGASRKTYQPDESVTLSDASGAERSRKPPLRNNRNEINNADMRILKNTSLIMCFAVTLFGLPSAASEEGFARPVEQDPSSQTHQTDDTNPQKNAQPKTDPHMLGFPNSVKALIEQYCSEYGHCPNDDSASYGNWPNHFFALRGWMSDLTPNTLEEKEEIDAAIKDLNETYGGHFKVNSPEHLKTLPPPPKPYPLAKNSSMGLNDAVRTIPYHYQRISIPLKPPPQRLSPRGTNNQIKKQEFWRKIPADRNYLNDAIPEEFR